MIAIKETTTVRELLTAHPKVIAVLIGHGMCPDCKDDPPPIPLHQFAAKHCNGEIGALVAELEQAVEVND